MSGPGVKAGQNYIGTTSVSHRSQFDDNAVPQQAELQAMIEEQKTQDKIRAKQNQVEQFRAKTATAAQQRLKQERAQKKKEEELAKAQERERQLKSKEYGAKQREMAARKASQKKKEKEVTEKTSKQKPQPHAYKNTHAITPEIIQNALQQEQETIKEQDEELEQSQILNVDLKNHQGEYEHKTKIINMYKRIDQQTLNNAGFKQKKLLSEESIEEVHQFSMLQRFRSNRDFKMFDKMKPVPVTARDLNSDESDAEDTENVNTKNIRGSKTERIQGAKMIAINNEL